jgi:hypothetical protein
VYDVSTFSALKTIDSKLPALALLGRQWNHDWIDILMRIASSPAGNRYREHAGMLVISPRRIPHGIAVDGFRCIAREGTGP